MAFLWDECSSSLCPYLVFLSAWPVNGIPEICHLFCQGALDPLLAQDRCAGVTSPQEQNKLVDFRTASWLLLLISGTDLVPE